MNTREAYKALLDGHKVKDADGDVWEMNEGGFIRCSFARADEHFPDFAPFELFVEPATDAELAAEMRRRSIEAGLFAARDAWRTAAYLEKRSVKP